MPNGRYPRRPAAMYLRLQLSDLEEWSIFAGWSRNRGIGYSERDPTRCWYIPTICGPNRVSDEWIDIIRSEIKLRQRRRVSTVSNGHSSHSLDVSLLRIRYQENRYTLDHGITVSFRVDSGETRDDKLMLVTRQTNIARSSGSPTAARFRRFRSSLYDSVVQCATNQFSEIPYLCFICSFIRV